jgi:outer membrane protein OmpA-like peptidoglycan-associated protein
MTSAIRWPLIVLIAGAIAAVPVRPAAAADADSTAAAARPAEPDAKQAVRDARQAERDAKKAAKLAKKAAADSVKAAKKAVREANPNPSMSAADLTAAKVSPDSAAAKKAADRAAKDAARAAKKAASDEKKAAARAAKAGHVGGATAVGSGAGGATPADSGAVAARSPAPSGKDAARAAKKAAREEKKATARAAKAGRAAAKPSAGEPAIAVAAPVPASGRALTRLGKRLSDEVIARDLGWIDEMKAKIAALPGMPDPWRVAGARLWLDAAREEYLDNDETGFDQYAFSTAATMVEALASGAEPVTKDNVPSAQLLPGSSRLRGDLWDKLETLKHDEGFQCAAAELAMLEVELQWAGHEHADRGECGSNPHLEAADQHALAAQALVAGCRKPEVKVVEAPPPPPPVPVPQPPLQRPTAEELKVPKDCHFALNKFDVGPTSLSVINGVANVLLKYPSVYVHLTGHTDSRGSDAYNLLLSQRRVSAVYQVLRDLGIDSTRITIEFVGKSKLYAAEVSKKGYALNRRVEMEFQDSEGREIKAERTEADLQLEGDKPPPPPPPPPHRVRPRTTIRTKPAHPAGADSTTRVAPRAPRQGAVEPPMIERKPAARDTTRH